MVDWSKKLSSRKFWGLIVALIGSVLLFLNVDKGTTEQILAIVGGFSSIIIYILAESYIDGKAVETEIIIIEEVAEDE